MVPVAAVAEEGSKSGSMKRKAEVAPPEEIGPEKKAIVEHQGALIVPLQKQPRRVLAFELYVMDKSTVKQSAAWFTQLSDQERREYFELEVRREQIAEAQRGSLERLLAKKVGFARRQKRNHLTLKIKEAPLDPSRGPPLRKTTGGVLLKLKRPTKKPGAAAAMVPPPPSAAPAAAAVAGAPVAAAAQGGSGRAGSELAQRAYEEFTKDHSGYFDATNTFVLRSEEELRRMFSELPNEMTSVYFNRAYSKQPAK